MTWMDSPTERILRRYHCGYCGAKPGEACSTISGWVSLLSHKDRFIQARTDGALGTP